MPVVPAVPVLEIDEDFWKNRVEVDIEAALRPLRDATAMFEWAKKLGPRHRRILAEEFDLDEDALTVKEVKDAIVGRHDDLAPFLLAQAFTDGKWTHAILEVARAKLPLPDVEACRVAATGDEEDYDREARDALVWLLYLYAPENLPLVFHRNWAEKKGFARMVMRDRRVEADRQATPLAPTMPVAEFLSKDGVQVALDRFEKSVGSDRRSQCAAVLNHGGNYQAFIKRGLKSSFVTDGMTGDNTYGYEREWIVLEFEPDLRRVYVCSESEAIPTRLANHLAAEYFGVRVGDLEFINELIVTPPETVAAFLAYLVAHSDEMPLVEIHAANSALSGAPALMLSSPPKVNGSLGPALAQYQQAFGANLLDHIGDIASIKVHAHDKRIRMMFEVEDPGQGRRRKDPIAAIPPAALGFVVRYADQPLAGKERREFEQMMETKHHIVVLSTEKKRHART